ncbi:nucleotide exchange factor GrpE [Desulfocicer vacuolatum]|uniref:nucleotide exchange factor GrpE n=1 Tax=Desulfocicer vacuolatum TaxID=2298 RepID=UPI0009FC77E1|nr:nucleotide exchange factor GrpE [Desulfocicer vacuolatum]
MLADKDEPLKEETGKKSGDETTKSAQSPSVEDSTQEQESCSKDKSSEEKPDIATLQAELKTEKDKALRLSAEFENYKKRSSREISDFRKYANESVFKKLLTVVDNLERAIDSGETQNNQASILEGIQLTHKELIKLFEAFNIKAIEALNLPFDPAFHQAVTQQETDEHPDNTVISELQKGYVLHDRLLRPSMVVVSKAVVKQDN